MKRRYRLEWSHIPILGIAVPSARLSQLAPWRPRFTPPLERYEGGQMEFEAISP